MTLEQFETEINRLKDVYGDRNYSDERVKILWREVKDFDSSWFAKTVDNLIGTCKQAPLMIEFREAISLQRSKNKFKKDDEWIPPNVSNCNFCFGTGVFLCRKENDPGLWAFRCHCAHGLADTRTAIPRFTKNHETDFFFANIKPKGVQASV